MKNTETNSPPPARSPIGVLRRIFLEKKEKNSNYSLNAFARDLGISPSLISRILGGSRPLTLKQGLHIAAVLKFSQSETNFFIQEIVSASALNSKISKPLRDQIEAQMKKGEIHSPVFYINYEVERFKAIAEWYHIAILNLTFVKDFNSRPEWVAERLGISSAEAKEAIDRLLELGLLETVDGVLKKTGSGLYIKTSKSETAVRSFHTQMIDKAKAELNKTSDENFQERLINAVTFACDPEHLPLLKNKLNEFQDEILSLAQSGRAQEVYQLNCQLFPLTKKQNSKPKKLEKKK